MIDKSFHLEAISSHSFIHRNTFLFQEELEREGIWDFDRLSRPYIQQQFLQVTEVYIIIFIIYYILYSVINGNISLLLGSFN